jgi:mono/diheme cytochrome c family protein
LLLVLSAALLVVASCAQEEYPLALWEAQHPLLEGGTGPDSSVQGPIACTQARAESIPARLVAMSGNTSVAASAAIFVSNIYQEQFVPICGGCHVSASQGGFQVSSASDFAMQMTPAVLAHVTGAVCKPGSASAPDPTNPIDPMPPCGGPSAETYSQRTANDPVRLFAEVVQEWIAAGRPPSSFTPGGGSGGGSDAGDAGDAGAPASPYLLTPAVGNALTEIGNCIPAGLATVEDPKSAALDKMFAGLNADPTASGPAAVGLPETLSETDLITFDSSILALYGVIAYAPAYPLWSDNAYKLRHVRVPYGKSIHFDKATQQFEIPPNTRFYKTFTKQIIDTDGSYRYRKIETRLIVSRPDENNSDGTAKAQTALFGTYQWCAAGTNVPCPAGAPDESEAYLVTQPLKSEEPFADTLLLYDTDEPLAADILKGQPADPEGALLAVDLVAGHPAARHYAIPSSQRCVQCHMGSPSEAFILGFTPLQINWRPTGVGGVIEEAGPDELTQLRRFVDAGVITGIDSLSDVLPLESSQGSRLPRNNYELVAQGYAVGNCQHCHNPRGFPSVEDPRLKDIFDFLPSATGGGIFQFPLERYSPAIGRGLTGSTLIPFITPSLVDQPRLVTTATGSGGAVTGSPAADIFVQGGGATTAPNSVIYAPWRSLIYRNVDSAFAYTDDVALFPHMPFNTPGYDPRPKQIFSDWMVSIPAVRKHPEIIEYAYQVDSNPDDNIGSPVVDSTPQPYVEVIPGAPGYDDAVAAATSRLAILHTGVNPALPVLVPPGDAGARVIYSRYNDPGDTDDIEDPAVLADPTCHPIPVAAGPPVPYPFPNHPHWVITDTSQPPPPGSRGTPTGNPSSSSNSHRRSTRAAACRPVSRGPSMIRSTPSLCFRMQPSIK